MQVGILHILYLSLKKFAEKMFIWHVYIEKTYTLMNRSACDINHANGKI